MNLVARYSILSALYFLGVAGARAAAGTVVTNSSNDWMGLVLPPRVLGQLPNGAIVVQTFSDTWFADENGKLTIDLGNEQLIGPVTTLAVASDGGFFLAGSGVVKFRADGSADPDFKPAYTVGTVISGSTGGSRVARDVIFSGGQSAGSIGSIAGDEAGGCYIAGAFVGVNDQTVAGVAHLDRWGNLLAWQPNSGSSFDGSILIVPDQGGLIGVGTAGISRLLSTGEVQDFQVDRVQWQKISAAAYDARFGLAVMGTGAGADQHNGSFCAVYRLDGTRNTQFGDTVTFGPFAGWYNNIAWDSHGRLLIGSVQDLTDPAKTDGALIADSPLAGPSLIGFPAQPFSIKRLLPDGTLDPTWTRALWFDQPPWRVVVLADDSVLANGGFYQVCGFARPYVVRLTAADTAMHQPEHSARGRVEPGSQQVIMGLVLEGTTATDVLIRASGPSLAQFGVTKFPSATKFSVYHGNTLVVRTGVGTDTVPVRWVASRVGAFPFDQSTSAAEAQALLSLPPGAYTVVIDAPASAGSGDILGEIYFP